MLSHHALTKAVVSKRWRVLCVALAVSFLVVIPVALTCNDLGMIFYFILIVPLAGFTLLMYSMLGSDLTLFLAACIFCGVSWLSFRNYSDIRAYSRWVLWSGSFKDAVLAQPMPPDGSLRHVVWDATGFAGIANITTYVVYDPKNALRDSMRRSATGRWIGLPCEVYKATRLQPHWYSVIFYTDTNWESCAAKQRSGIVPR